MHSLLRRRSCGYQAIHRVVHPPLAVFASYLSSLGSESPSPSCQLAGSASLHRHPAYSHTIRTFAASSPAETYMPGKSARRPSRAATCIWDTSMRRHRTRTYTQDRRSPWAAARRRVPRIVRDMVLPQVPGTCPSHGDVRVPLHRGEAQHNQQRVLCAGAYLNLAGARRRPVSLFVTYKYCWLETSRSHPLAPYSTMLGQVRSEQVIARSSVHVWGVAPLGPFQAEEESGVLQLAREHTMRAAATLGSS